MTRRTLNDVAHRMARWAHGLSPAAVSAGYCMSGRWDSFYQRLLFPNKMFRDDVALALIERLRKLGFNAALEVTPFPCGNGLYLYMRMIPVIR